MKVIEVSGEPRAIGEQTGEATREECRRNLDLHRPDLAKLGPRLATYEAVLRRDLPDILAELEGLAAGADLPRELVLAHNFSAFPNALVVGDGCSNLAIAGGPDGPLWAKNNDGCEPARQRTTVVRVVRPRHGIPTIYVHFAGVVGVGDAMNAEGLCVGHSSVGSKFQMSDQFCGIREWNHEQMKRCRTTAELVAAMAAKPLRGKGFAMVVADRAGTICALEAPCPLLQVRAPSDPRFVACTNRYFLPALVAADRRPPGHKEEATARLAMIERSLAAHDRLDLAAIDATMALHEDPVSTCKHGDTVGHWTEYGIRAEAAHGRLHLLSGLPCSNQRQTISV